MKVYALIFNNVGESTEADVCLYSDYEGAKQAWLEAKEDVLSRDINPTDNDEEHLYIGWDDGYTWSEIYVTEKHVWGSGEGEVSVA